MDVQKEKIRTVIKGLYDIQKLRVATGNRIVASLRPIEMARIKSAMGEEADPDKQQAEADKILKKIAAEYNTLTDYLAKQQKTKAVLNKHIEILGSELTYVKSRADYDLVESYSFLLSAEKNFEDSVKREVEQHPLWDAFFAGVGGCGPLMAAVCIAYLDPYKARYPSSFWKYAGLDVVNVEGKDEGRQRWHVEDVQYEVDGEVRTKKGLTYNPFLKTKLVGVLGGSFLKARGGSKYADIYYDYKRRLENRHEEDENVKRPVVIHRRATRYAVKQFLADLWVAWRTIENLPTGHPYAVDFLGRDEHHSPRNQPIGVTLAPAVSDINLDDISETDA